MYLDDTEVELLLEKMLEWVREGEYLFCRESCFFQSGEWHLSQAMFDRSALLNLPTSADIVAIL
jgi:hypothetical protein